MVVAGLVHGTAGNVSARVGARIAITPSGLAYAAMSPLDVVVLDAAGVTLEGDRVPSSEKAVHLEIYRARPDVGAIVHTHSTAATAAAAIGEPLPAFLIEAAVSFRGAIPVAPFRMTGTPELGVQAARSLGAGRAVLLESHGAVTVGDDLAQALELAIALEEVAKVYLAVLAAGRLPRPLPATILS